MDYFRKYLIGQGEGQSPSGTDTIERLCDRVQSSTLLEDRRDAVRALKSLSRKYRVEVGTMAMEILVNVLQVDRSDAEILGYSLETLCNVMSNEPLDEELELQIDLPDDLGSQFTEVFIKTTDNVSLLLSLLEEYDFHVRWPTVKLITLLLANRAKLIQEIILANPMGVSKMMDLLSDSREIVRNDGLLLLTQLTKGNTNIQKIVAFENAFERLLDIISEEGSSDGGIVVEDCLLLLINLMKNNQSNQNYFKEGTYIQKLAPFFELHAADENPQGGWSAQKVTNIHLMLQVVRTLVSPSNPLLQTVTCQKVMYICGLLEKLSYILMASGVPADVLSETINTVSEIIRGNQGNQEYFASVMAPSTPPRPVIVVLLMSMVNEKQPFSLRCAVLYCFQSFLHKNELGQSQIIQTLLPSTAEVNTISAGQLLCGGLFSADSMSTWFAAVALLHCVANNPTQKEQLLRVQLATSLGNPPVSLLQQATNILAQGGKLQTCVGILMLLCNWMSNSPTAVTHFLHNSANVPYLISQVSSSEGEELDIVVQGLCAFLLGICVLYNDDKVETNTKATLRAVIEKRIGLEIFTDKLSQVTKNEMYSRAAKKPQLNYKQPGEVIFDYAFTQLFRKLEHEVLQSVSSSSDTETTEQKTQSIHDHQNIVLQYQEVIRKQDGEINDLKSQVSALAAQDEISHKMEKDYKQQIQLLKDHNSLLKASKGSMSAVGNEDPSEMSKLQQEIHTKHDEIEKLKKDLTASEGSKVINSENEQSPSESTMLQSTVDRLTKDIDELKLKIEQKNEEIILYKMKYEDSSKKREVVQGSAENDTTTAILIERNNLSTRIVELEKQVGYMELENSQHIHEKQSLKQKLYKLEEENTNLNQKVKNIVIEKQRLDNEKIHLLESIESHKKEHEDLLVLMSDQLAKLEDYRQKLKVHGEILTEDEDDDDDDDDDEDEDIDDISDTEDD